jgi:pentatricopeptide repeat protein
MIGGSIMTIGKNIKALRESLGLTQEQLAEKLHISYQAVSKWETSQNVPDTMMLPAISKIFGVTIDELFREKRENYDNLAGKLAAIYEDTKRKEDFLQADLAYNRLFTEGKYTARDLYTYGYINWFYAWNCFHIAEENFNRAMELAGDENNRIYRDALARMIDLKGDMKQSQQMIDKLKTMHEERPDSSFHRNMLISAYITDRQIDKAEKMVDEALSSGQEEWFLYQTKGDFLQSRNLLQEALTCFEKAWIIDCETYCDTLYSFVCIYKQLGDKEKAIEYCKKWIKWYEDRGAIIEKKTVERELENLQ